MYNRFKIGVTLGVLVLTLSSCGNSGGSEEVLMTDYTQENQSVESMPSSVTYNVPNSQDHLNKHSYFTKL